MSAVKRKREPMFESSLVPLSGRKAIERSARKQTPSKLAVNCLDKYDAAQNMANGMILKNGDVLLVCNEYSGALLCICMDALLGSLRNDRAEYMLDGISSSIPSSNIDIRARVGVSRELVVCSCEGDFALLSTRSDGQATDYYRHSIDLNDEELVTCVLHADTSFLLGTSKGNVFVVQREADDSICGYQLERTHLSIAGLFKTIDRMIRGSGTGPSKEPIMSIHLPFASENTLVCMGRTLYVWNNWDREMDGAHRESCKEYAMLDTIVDDIQSVDNRFKDRFELQDVAIMPNDMSNSRCVTMVVLTSVSSFEEENPGSSFSLWLHVLELSLVQIDGVSGVDALRVASRCFVAGNVALGSVLPQVHTLLPSWHVYLSWGGLKANHDAPVLCATQLDVRSLPDISDPDHSADVALVSAVGCEDTGSEDTYIAPNATVTGLPYSDVESVAVVTNMKELAIFTKEGSLYTVYPSLCPRLTSSFLPGYLDDTLSSKAKRSATALDKAEHRADPKKLLLAVIKGNESVDAAVPVLKGSFSRIAPAALMQLITPISNDIVSRPHTGQSWGGNAADTDTDLSTLSTAQYQLAHRVVEKKSQEHQMLIETLISTGALMSPYGLGLVESASLLSTHQQVLVAQGLSTAIYRMQERAYQQRTQPQALVNTKSTNISSMPKSATKPQHKSSKIFAFDDDDGRVGDAGEAAATYASLYPTPGGTMTTPAPSPRRVGATPGGLYAPSAEAGFVAAAGKLALNILGRALEYAVLVIRKQHKQEFELKGLSVADVFFSDTSRIGDGFVASAYALEDAAKDANMDTSTLFSAAFGTVSCLVSAVQAAADGVGGDNAHSAFLCRREPSGKAVARDAFIAIMQNMRSFVDVGAESSSTATPTQIEWSNYERSVQGTRLRLACKLILQSFILEATDMFPDESEGTSQGVLDGRHGDAHWREQFQHAKNVCIDLLLDLGHAKTAFALSQEFLYFSGMLQSIDVLKRLETARASSGIDFRRAFSGSTQLWQELLSFVRQCPSVRGTETLPLATYCMEWLQEKGRITDLLQIGKLAEDQLMAFLENRPQIAAVHHLSAGTENYMAGSEAAVYHARSEGHAESASTMLSIGKLAAVAAEGDLKGIENAYASSIPVYATAIGGIQSAAGMEASQQLSILQAQEILMGRSSAIAKDVASSGSRLGCAELINVLCDTIADEVAHPSIEDSDPQEDVRSLAHLAMALISMRADDLDKCAALAEGSDDDARLVQQEWGALRTQLTRIYGQVVRADQATWRDLAVAHVCAEKARAPLGDAGALGDTLSAAEEEALLDTCLHGLLWDVREEVITKVLRADILVDMKARSGGSAGSAGDGNAACLKVSVDDVIKHAAVAVNVEAALLDPAVSACLLSGSNSETSSTMKTAVVARISRLIYAGASMSEAAGQ